MSPKGIGIGIIISLGIWIFALLLMSQHVQNDCHALFNTGMSQKELDSIRQWVNSCNWENQTQQYILWAIPLTFTPLSIFLMGKVWLPEETSAVYNNMGERVQ